MDVASDTERILHGTGQGGPSGWAGMIQGVKGALGVQIRQGGREDFPALAHLHEVTYGVSRSLENFHWLYEANPAGRCRLWVAEDRATGRLLGIRPVFPWRLWLQGRAILGAQLGDAMTHPHFRNRGIFTALTTVAAAALSEEEVPFTFSFPNPRSMSVYGKLNRGGSGREGSHEVLKLRRMVRPLSVGGFLRGGGAGGTLTRGLDRLARPYLRRHLELRESFSVFPVRRFDSELDELWRRARHAYGLLTIRDSIHLNWRFIDPPGGSFRVLGLRHGGDLVGYIAFEVDPTGHGWIADLFGLARQEITCALLRAALGQMSDDGAVRASMWVSTASPSYPLARAHGFIQRNDVLPMAVQVYRDGPQAAVALDPSRWWAWLGDRDVERQVPPSSMAQDLR